MKPFILISLMIFSLIYSWTCFAGDVADGKLLGVDPYLRERINNDLREKAFRDKTAINDPNNPNNRIQGIIPDLLSDKELAAPPKTDLGLADWEKVCLVAISNEMFLTPLLASQFPDNKRLVPAEEMASSKMDKSFRTLQKHLEANFNEKNPMLPDQVDRLKNGFCKCEGHERNLNETIANAKKAIIGNDNIRKNQFKVWPPLQPEDLQCGKPLS